MSDNRAKIECPGDSLRSCIASHPRDWATDHRDAWLYGIVCGWDSALHEVAQKHGWSSGEVARLRRLHAKFSQAFPENDR